MHGFLPPSVVQLTPLGRGAVATLRLEGAGAVEAVERFFRARSGRSLESCRHDRLLVGCFGGEDGEEVVVRRCASDAVEIHCHGGFAAVRMIEDLLVSAGCRRQGWRDWASGLDGDSIASAARIAMAEARTERTAALLLDQHQGALRMAVDEIEQAMERGDAGFALHRVRAILARSDLGRHLTTPWRVVLAGKTNVGKSSLLNALAGFQRAIVHHQPGTTRDMVTVSTAIDGWPVELCDTAGLRDADDSVELAGIARARRRIAQADLVLLVSDGTLPWSQEDQAILKEWPSSLVVHNKCDLPTSAGDRPDGIWVSAVLGQGMDLVLKGIAERLVPVPPVPGSPVPFTQDQISHLKGLAAKIAGTLDGDRLA